MLEVRPLASGDLDDLDRLFSADRATAGCWCMWFIVPVKVYHAGGGAANATRFRDLAQASDLPLGLIARRDGEPVGWAACGPRSRYKRAIKTPTLADAPAEDDERFWLAPCFYVRPQNRRAGIARALLEGALAFAARHGAAALDGFPTVRAGTSDRQVGTEHLFHSLGFRPISRPSANRVVMRRDLANGS